MALYTPTVTNYPNGVVSVISQDSTPYNEVLASMGSFVYRIEKIYLKANQNDQIAQPLDFFRYDSNGDIERVKRVPAIDPFQYQTSIDLDFNEDNFVLDGRTSIDFIINPNEDVFFYLTTFEISNLDLLNGTSDVNEDFLQTYGMFDEYVERIPITFDNDEKLPTSFFTIECD